MPITINLKAFTDRISDYPSDTLRDRDFERLCADNPDIKFETTEDGKLIVMPPTGGLTGIKNSDLTYQVYAWNHQTKLGEVFGSSTGFKLSNGAIRSPDVSWIELSRWNNLTAKQQEGFAPIDPDFVIELMSPTDYLDEFQLKMAEYMACGIKLGILINPDGKQVEIYRLGQEKEILNNPKSLSGEKLLSGLIIDLLAIL